MLIYLLPFIAALTGYITNFIAVKMLFHPRNPVNLGFMTIQGIFPKRQGVLAERLGAIVSQELFSVEDVKQEIGKPEVTAKLNGVIENRIDLFLQEKLPASMPMLAMFLNDETKGKIKGTLMEEFELMLPGLVDTLGNELEARIDVAEVVKEKVTNFSSDKLEEILYSIMKKEFRFIEILGGILGFLIGLIQLLLVQLA
ncbi:MAG TPA: DUF445 domain-containing protein [Cytophagales bacterium]|nr:DUF445 domain-containing protein [Cytophagales bacterium]HAA17264.1 DUF445 domain-containing protein [Cytophagales bacterium]HAP63422.1 DUF445 domain-containing protein [Cytophagales bacterium]